MIDPLLRGIYYLYIYADPVPPILIKDREAVKALSRFWLLNCAKEGDWNYNFSKLYNDRAVFVEELGRRAEHD